MLVVVEVVAVLLAALVVELVVLELALDYPYLEVLVQLLLEMVELEEQLILMELKVVHQYSYP